MSKLTYLLQTAGLAFVLAALMAPVIIKKLRELKFGQKILEDGPTWHKGKQNTPTMGGVIFIAAMTLAVLTTLPAMASAHDYRPRAAGAAGRAAHHREQKRHSQRSGKAHGHQRRAHRHPLRHQPRL